MSNTRVLCEECGFPLVWCKCNKQDAITVEVYQQDWIPGFASFVDDSSIHENGKAHVGINIGGLMVAVNNGELDAKELPYQIAESIMHEVIHSLEAWAGVEFSEDKVEKLIEKYREKYHEK
jgi:hypothetical protein